MANAIPVSGTGKVAPKVEDVKLPAAPKVPNYKSPEGAPLDSHKAIRRDF